MVEWEVCDVNVANAFNFCWSPPLVSSVVENVYHRIEFVHLTAGAYTDTEINQIFYLMLNCEGHSST
jgi:hypothetical protein